MGEAEEFGEEPRSAAARQLYEDWIRDEAGGARARELLHTQYHKRDKSVAASIGDW